MYEQIITNQKKIEKIIIEKNQQKKNDHREKFKQKFF